MLCSICAGIFRGNRPPLWAPASEAIQANGSRDFHREGEIERESLRRLHDDIAQLANGAVWGCTICDVVWRHFFRDKTAQEYQHNPMFMRNGMIHSFVGSGTHYRILKPKRWRRDDYGPYALEVQVALNSPMDKDIPEYKELTLDPVEDEPAVDLASLPKPDLSIYGSHTFQTIQSWIGNCKQHHRKCASESSLPVRYPTRLLDLEYRAPSEPRRQQEAIAHLFRTGHLPADCRLIETSEASVAGDYMTLSHRWDVHRKPCITNRSNIEQRMHNIPASDLPKVFEDAIHLTRCLGVRYLWIDSLCIIQGDEEDWKREALTMGRVYTHSMLNLEATVGNSSLLQPRNPKLIAPCIVRSHWTGFKSIRYVVTDYRYWDSRIYKSVCNTRAWITQERWLAPRVLHFTFDQLIWECCELEAGEPYPHGLAKEMKSQSSIGFKKLKSEPGTDNDTPSSYEARLEDWRGVFLTYSRAELTYSADRLVAIAGIASRFSKILDDEWLAGLWRKNLPGELLWYVAKTRRSNKPPPPMEIVAERGLGIKRMHQVHLSERLKGVQYQAPSWSWASVLGDIVPGFFTTEGSEDSMIDVFGVDLVPLDAKKPLGRLVGGTLKLRGTLYQMAMDPPDWTPELASKDYRMWRPRIYLTSLGKKGSVHLQADEPTSHVDLARSCFLPIRKHIINSPESQYHGSTLVCGLALMPTGQRGEYTRLGRVDFSNHADDDAISLFVDGLKTQREGRLHPAMQADSEAQDAELYVEDEVGVFTIV